MNIFCLFALNKYKYCQRYKCELFITLSISGYNNGLRKKKIITERERKREKKKFVEKRHSIYNCCFQNLQCLWLYDAFVDGLCQNVLYMNAEGLTNIYVSLCFHFNIFMPFLFGKNKLLKIFKQSPTELPY